MSSAQDFLKTARFECRRLQRQAENAIAQCPSDESFYAQLDAETNSIAILVQHISGNLISRWTDFLETDGEKPTRRRDTEFEDPEGMGRDRLFERWNRGFDLMAETLDGLSPDDLTREVTIRGEAFSVLQAITRSMLHVSEHVGQIVLLAKHSAGTDWRSLSIPKGQSESARGGYKLR